MGLLKRHLFSAFFLLAICGAAQSELPAGKGQEVVKKVCAGCHAFTVITQNHATRDRWEAIVENMVSRGAEATDNEIDQMVEYLATHFGPSSQQKVNVNKAAAEELATALALPAERAAAIVEYRASHGSFKDLDGLKKVPGIDSKRIEERKDWIEF